MLIIFLTIVRGQPIATSSIYIKDELFCIIQELTKA